MLPPGGADAIVFRAAAAAAVRERALVLSARGVPHAMIRDGRSHALVVPHAWAERAAAELSAYASENANWPPVDDPAAPTSRGALSCLVYGALLALVHRATVADWGGWPWWDAGMADATAIRGGEWWRTLTALTLHDGLPHLMGNLVFGVAFGAMACQTVGTGLAWCAILFAGAAGNALDAAIRPGEHLSVGASTAIFGALGLAATYRALRRRRRRFGRFATWAPLAAGVGLLAYLGFGGADGPGRVNVIAHLLGFGAGAALGAWIAAWRRLPGPAAQRVLAAVPVIVLGLAWARALAGGALP